MKNGPVVFIFYTPTKTHLLSQKEFKKVDTVGKNYGNFGRAVTNPSGKVKGLWQLQPLKLIIFIFIYYFSGCFTTTHSRDFWRPVKVHWVIQFQWACFFPRQRSLNNMTGLIFNYILFLFSLDRVLTWKKSLMSMINFGPIIWFLAWKEKKGLPLPTVCCVRKAGYIIIPYVQRVWKKPSYIRQEFIDLLIFIKFSNLNIEKARVVCLLLLFVSNTLS